MKQSHYNKKLRHFAKKLRNDSTDGEIILWKKVLRARQMYGYQFNRQFPVENYIVDFICRKLRIVIEVDGYSHQFKIEEDKERDKRLLEIGYQTIRIQEYDIKTDLKNVIIAIESLVLDQEKDLGFKQ
ncbi:endonuclease domain-containing protein [Saccharicrinis sp. GN24d3]|uniref:endonuclease domain-containing protein n=1 Tax=Saccharicrinis sp. GN24d3 TaxID=3458416 RepID=UPI004035BB75